MHAEPNPTTGTAGFRDRGNHGGRSVSSSRCAKEGKEGWATTMASHKSGQNFDLLGQPHMCTQKHWGSVKENQQVIELLGQAQTSMTLFKITVLHPVRRNVANCRLMTC